MIHFLYYTILVLLVMQFLTERILQQLNRSYRSEVVPDELKDIIDQDKYSRSQQYEKANDQIDTITSVLSFAFTLALFIPGLLGMLDQYIACFLPGPFLNALLFFVVLGLLAEVLGLPFQAYSTFVIEKRFGFNRTTLKTFIADKIKGWLLALVLGGGLLALLLWMYQWSGSWFWVIAWGTITLISLFMTLFYTNLILPLFNKLTPLEDGSLRNKISELAGKLGFKMTHIGVIDGSKRSTKANAFFSGLGPRKRVVLYDTLIRDHTEEEVVAVLAHEIGHYKLKHVLRGQLLSVMQTGIFLYLLSLLLENSSLSEALGSSRPSFQLNLIGFALLYMPVSMLSGLIGNHLSRKFEYEADAFARVHFSGFHLGEALKKMSVNQLSNLNPHPAYVFFYYSHPTLLQRLHSLGFKNQQSFP